MFPFPGQWGWSESGSHLAGFWFLIHSEIEQGSSPQPLFQWTLPTSADGVKAVHVSWETDLSPVFKAAALGQGHRTQAAGESGRPAEALGSSSAGCGDIKHGWQCCLHILFIQHSIQERITMEKATPAGKVWGSWECYQGSHFFLSSSAVDSRTKATEHVCLILYVLNVSLHLHSECPHSGCPAPLWHVPFTSSFLQGKLLAPHSSTGLRGVGRPPRKPQGCSFKKSWPSLTNWKQTAWCPACSPNLRDLWGPGQLRNSRVNWCQGSIRPTGCAWVRLGSNTKQAAFKTSLTPFIPWLREAPQSSSCT